jgi:radical SAM protein with 4Fe4S-binding SPASM domain
MSAPDLLRLEGFGAVYYQRSTGDTLLFPEHLARLLAASRERGIVEAFARDPDAQRALSDLAFAREVADLRKRGVLDAGYRVRARLIDGRPAGVTLSAPLVTHIQTTLACNLACTHCYVPVTPNAAPDEMDTDTLVGLIEELGEIGCPVVVLAGGEPMRRPDLFEVLDAVGRAGVDATLCTNATLVTRQTADRIARTALKAVNVSLDGPDAETHDTIRGAGQFQRAIRGARHLAEAGIPELKLRVTVTATNADRLTALAPLARELGATAVVMKAFDQVGVASAQLGLVIDRRQWLEITERLQQAWPGDAPPLVLGDGMPTRPPPFAPLIPTFGCVGGTTSATVLPDGAVVACGVFRADDDWTLKTHTFTECWRGAESIERWRHLEANEQCRTCAHLEVCGGGCRARAVGAGRSFTAPDPFARCSLRVPRESPEGRQLLALHAVETEAVRGARRLPMV